MLHVIIVQPFAVGTYPASDHHQPVCVYVLYVYLYMLRKFPQMVLVNQVVQDGATGSFLTSRRKDQQRALQRLREDPELRCVFAVLPTHVLFAMVARGTYITSEMQVAGGHRGTADRLGGEGRSRADILWRLGVEITHKVSHWFL